MADDRDRCPWAGTDPIYVHYHDHEWGIPLRDERRLFEMLVLEGAQAGLAWITILRKREGYRHAFADWNVDAIADFGARDRARLLADAGIVRNRLKIDAAIGNAKAAIAVRQELGGMGPLLWSFTGGKPLVNQFRAMSEVPAETPESKAMSKELKRRGFRFVGPTICYAFMQATGMVNDHLLSCFHRARHV